MGYLAKHIKVRRHRWQMKIIANAALAGCRFVPVPAQRHHDANDGEWPYLKVVREWAVQYPDGQTSTAYDSKYAAALIYLTWWFCKQEMWPQYRAAMKGRLVYVHRR